METEGENSAYGSSFWIALLAARPPSPLPVKTKSSKCTLIAYSQKRWLAAFVTCRVLQLLVKRGDDKRCDKLLY